MLQPSPNAKIPPTKKKQEKASIGGPADGLLKQSPFMLQIKINSIKELIKGCFKKEPTLVGKNMKDAHISTVGSDFLLLSVNKNAQVISLATLEVVTDLNLKNREMASSLFYGRIVLIGTYVDTLFVFSYGDFSPLFNLRCHDSILSICYLSTDHNFIALG